MKKTLKKWLVLTAASAGILFAGAFPVHAFTDENAQAEVIPVETEAPAPETEAVPETEATPFSIPGNGQILDDKPDDGTKQFVTVQTKNGNTFFLVLDRSSNTENAYMLSMIDENDLAEFLGDTEEPETEQTPLQVLIPETEPIPEETEPEPVPEAAGNEKMDKLAVFAICLLLMGLIGTVYYFKVIKPGKTESGAGGEGLELYDGGEYINEDREGDSGNEEDD